MSWAGLLWLWKDLSPRKDVFMPLSSPIQKLVILADKKLDWLVQQDRGSAVEHLCPWSDKAISCTLLNKLSYQTEHFGRVRCTAALFDSACGIVSVRDQTLKVSPALNSSLTTFITIQSPACLGEEKVRLQCSPSTHRAADCG